MRLVPLQLSLASSCGREKNGTRPAEGASPRGRRAALGLDNWSPFIYLHRDSRFPVKGLSNVLPLKPFWPWL